MNKTDWLRRRHEINQQLGHDPKVQLGFKCFPYTVDFNPQHGQISVTPDHNFFLHVTRELMDQLTSKMMADITAFKFTKLDQRIAMHVHSIFYAHIQDLMAKDLAFNRYVCSHQA